MKVTIVLLGVFLGVFQVRTLFKQVIVAKQVKPIFERLKSI